jgi:cysteine desulfurase
LEALKQYALNTLDCVFLPGHDAPHILGVALPGCPGQVAQRLLSEQGIMVSTGSACSRGKKSAALIAMKQPNDVVESALRLSFGAGNTELEIDRLDAALRDLRRRFGR